MCYEAAMNQINHRTQDGEQIARIRDVVSRHPLPEMVTGFDVALGEFDGTPGIWVSFFVRGEEVGGIAAGGRTQKLFELERAVNRDLLDTFEDHYPFFRFPRDTTLQPANH